MHTWIAHPALGCLASEPSAYGRAAELSGFFDSGAVS